MLRPTHNGHAREIDLKSIFGIVCESTQRRKRLERNLTMTPQISILDEAFSYVPARNTDVQQTWRRFAWVPMSEEERQRRLERASADQGGTSGTRTLTRFD